MHDYAPLSLGSIDGLPWGTHICQFATTPAQLRDAIVPYFKAGLENHERCLIVATAPFGTKDVRDALRAAVGDFDRREAAKQIAIHDVHDWYTTDSVIDGRAMVDGLLRNEEQARTDGYNGFRTNGNIGWITRNQWSDFQDYEARVSRGLKGRRLVSMCSYCLDTCTGQDVLDVVCRHDLTVTGHERDWTITGGTAHGIATQAADQQRLSLLVRELEHRIKNNLATVQALAGSTIRSARTFEEFDRSFTGRITALSRTHSMLTDGGKNEIPLRQLLEDELSIYADQNGPAVSLSGPDVILAARSAVSFGMAFHELTTNAVKHGALSSRGGELKVSWTRLGHGLQFRWNERMTHNVLPPARTGFGLQLLRRLLPHELGAQVELNFASDGLKATIDVKDLEPNP